MSDVNWGIATQPSSFQNALAQGFQIGQHIRQQNKEHETDNALAAYAVNPDDPAATAALLKANPQLGYRAITDQRERSAAAQTADVSRRAAQGDPEAMAQLAGMDLGAWRGLQADQRAQAAQEAKGLGNAALDVLNRPSEQRGQALMAYAQQMGNNPAILRVAQLPPEQQDAALRAAVAQADMIGKLHEMEQPHYQVIPEGGSLVDTSNPQAIQQYSQGMGAVPPPPPGFTLDQGGQPAQGTAPFQQAFGQ